MKYILKFKNYLIIGGMVLLFLGLSIFIYFKNNKITKNVTKANELVSKNEKEDIKKDDKTKEEEIKAFYVDIKGQVNNPGVYLVNETNIVNDVITFAGGLNTYADTKCINLSKKVTEEMVIYIYSKSETKELMSTKKANDNTICNTVKNNAYQNPKQEVATSSSSNNASNESTGLVNINTADVSGLTSLSGIGESKANDIINYRNQNGAFKSIDEIKNVSGIGDSTFEKIKDKITI